MPICEADPWRFQFFAESQCPKDVFIPTEDSDAWTWNPEHRWIYDKIQIALSQELLAGPHGTKPSGFPIFSKPIVNLRGMGIASRVIPSPEEYERALTPGHMWMTLLEGRHVSSDIAIHDGQPLWWRHSTGKPSREGMFDLWVVHAEPEPELEAYCGAWLSRHLGGYTGMVNLETMGGKIIEAHLRFSDQWPDLYGAGWVDALIRLYRDGIWRFEDGARQTGFSMPLFGPADRRYRHPDPHLVANILMTEGISSVQITFHEDRPPANHAMPPGGFRLAIINGWNLEAITAARRILSETFLAQG